MLTAAPLDDWRSAAAGVRGARRTGARSRCAGARPAWLLHGRVMCTGCTVSSLAPARRSCSRSASTRGAGDEEHIVGMAEAARCLAMLERDLTHADAMLMEAQALASRKHVSHHAIPAALGMLRFHENKLDEAVELFKEARTLARSSGDRHQRIPGTRIPGDDRNRAWPVRGGAHALRGADRARRTLARGQRAPVRVRARRALRVRHADDPGAARRRPSCNCARPTRSIAWRSR